MAPDALRTFTDAVMRGVIAAGLFDRLGRDEATIEFVVGIIRQETRAFLWGEKYAALREAVVARGLHEALATADVVTECVARALNEAPKRAA